MKKNKSAWWGFALIAVGAILLLDAVGNFDLGELFRTWWPLLLVIGGFRLLWSGKHPTALSPPRVLGDIVERVEGDRLEKSNVAGDIRLSTASRSFGGGTVTTVFGDVTVDCRAAAIAGGESTLKISTVFGDGTVYLPPDSAIRVSGHTLFGDTRVFTLRKGGFSTDVRYESPGYADAPARLRIDISQVFGDIEVSN